MIISSLDTFIVGFYIAGMLLIGIYVSRHVKNFIDFALAGRLLSTPLLAGTLVSTYYGLDVTFGSSETAYLEGVSTFFVYSLPFYLCYLGVAFFIVPRLFKLKVTSIPETISHFYGSAARIPAILATIFYSLPIISVAGLGLLGHFFFGLDPLLAACLGAAIAAFYTLFGGLLADVLTDSVQFFIMCVTLSSAAFFAMTEIVPPSQLRILMAPDIFKPLGTLSPADIITYSVIALTPLVEPAFYQRIFASRSAQSVTRALLISTLIWMAFDWLVIYLGIVGKYMVTKGTLSTNLDASEIILHVTAYLLPSGLLGLFIAGCIATAMSTVDSYSLISASSLVYDGLHYYTKNGLTDRQLILYTRIGIAISIALSLLISFRFERIRDAWIFMASILVSSLLVPLMAGFLLKQTGKRSGTYSIWAGFFSAALMFVSFETMGSYEPNLETQILSFSEYGLQLHREHLLFVAVPISLAAFIFGYIQDMRKK